MSSKNLASCLCLVYQNIYSHSGPLILPSSVQCNKQTICRSDPLYHSVLNLIQTLFFIIKVVFNLPRNTPRKIEPFVYRTTSRMALFPKGTVFALAFSFLFVHGKDFFLSLMLCP